VAVGAAATAIRLGAGVGRIVLLPGRLFVRSPFVRPVLRGRAEELAAAGREVEERGRRRLEDAAVGIAASPQTSRTLDRALTEAMSDEAIETLGRRLLESPAFERVIRDAAGSALARELVDDAIRSAELQRAVEDAIAGPVRGALGHQTKTLSSEVAGRLADAAARSDAALEHAVRRRAQPVDATAPQYGGLASRALGGLIDLALANIAVLALGALVGAVGVLFGVSLPGVVATVLAGAGWLLFLAGYAVLFWSTAGQTPGMRVVGLRLQDPTGAPPGVGRALLRFAATLVALAPLGAGFVPVLFDRRRRALQDFAARTVVLRDQRPADTT
jgi:uncharacterized RDD family membrane protein YckC